MAKKKSTASRAKWEYVGSIGVDSGQVTIGDPRYVGKSFKSAKKWTWTVTIPTGGGDGIYSVYALRGKNDRFIALHIDLNPFQ